MRGGQDHILRDERAGAEAEPLAVELKLPVTDVRYVLLVSSTQPTTAPVGAMIE